MNEIIIDFVLSERNKRMLVVNDFKFRNRKVLKDQAIYWVCSVNGCKANCYTKDDNICDHCLDHNHPVDTQKLGRQTINNICKRKAVDDIGEKPSKIICTEIARSSYKENITTTDMKLIRHNMNRNRLNTKTATSKNIVEVQDAAAIKKPASRKRKCGIEQQQKEFIKTCTEILQQMKTVDEYNAIGINVAAKLKKMDPAQQVLAEGLINKILMKGMFNLPAGALV